LAWDTGIGKEIHQMGKELTDITALGGFHSETMSRIFYMCFVMRQRCPMRRSILKRERWIKGIFAVVVSQIEDHTIARGVGTPHVSSNPFTSQQLSSPPLVEY